MSIRRYWTSYWQKRYWLANKPGEPLTLSGGSFRRRHVSSGDVIYVISQDSGQLLLGGRMVVDSVTSRNEAVRLGKRGDLYPANEWVVAQKGSGTPMRQKRRFAADVTKQLRFIAEDSQVRSLIFVNDSELDRQTTRSVRQLTPDSASLLDEIIEMTDALSKSAAVVITKRRLNRYRSERALAAPFHEEAVGALYPEGSIKEISVNRYERDSDARNACIRHYGAACAVCRLDFGVTYGDVAAGFIHVHHLVPLSSLGPDYMLNPVRDLLPVCPNCHAVLHHRTPPFEIVDVQEFIRKRKSDQQRSSETAHDLGLRAPKAARRADRS